MGKFLIIIGIVLIIAGLMIHFGVRLHWFGRLPGDFTIRREGFSVYLPFATSILVSFIVTLILYFLSKLK